MYLSNIILVDRLNPYGSGDEIYKISYVNIPVTIERNFGNKIKFNINAGLFVGFLADYIFITKVKQRFLPAGQPPTLEIFKTRNKGHNYSKTNFGLSFGAGVSIPVTKKISISINLKNNLGLLKVANIYDYSAPYDIKTNSISFLTGILFSL